MIRALLSLLFRAAIRARELLYLSGLARPIRVGARVISVGNISVGGAGKTPMTLFINDKLRLKGKRTAVIEKGYKSGLSSDEVILAQKGRDGIKEDAIGDEPLMVWKQIPSGTRLAVSSNKSRAAQEIMKTWPDTDVIIVDDGFQHLKLERDLDVVLIEAASGFKGKMMPLGRLREPYSALKRASVVVFTKSDTLTEEERNSLQQKALSINPGIKIFFSRINFSTSLPIRGKKVFPVSAIYDPSHFHAKIREAGGEFERFMAFSDHYRFTSSVIEGIFREAHKSGAEYVVLTSKDWVKIRPFTGDDSRIVESWYDHQLDNEGEFIKCCM